MSPLPIFGPSPLQQTRFFVGIFTIAPRHKLPLCQHPSVINAFHGGNRTPDTPSGHHKSRSVIWRNYFSKSPFFHGQLMLRRKSVGWGGGEGKGGRFAVFIRSNTSTFPFLVYWSFIMTIGVKFFIKFLVLMFVLCTLF